MYKFKIYIGDDSGDGHGEHDSFIIESNISVDSLRTAYKKSCKLLGIQFNINSDFTDLGIGWKHPEYSDRRLLCDYQENTISDLAGSILKKHGIDVESYNFTDPESLVHLIMDFIKLAVRNLEYRIVPEEDIEVFNTKGLNVQFGYGIYD